MGVLTHASPHAVAAQQAPPARAPERLTLRDAVRIAGRQALAAETSEAERDAAEARLRGSKAELMPRLGASATYLRRAYNRQSLGNPPLVLPGGTFAPDVIGPFSNEDARVSASFTVLDLGAVGRIAAARAADRAAEADVGAAREDAALAAAKAYVRLQRARSLVATRASDTTLALRLVDLAQHQHASGASAGIDVTRAQVRLAAARTAHAQAQAAEARARYELLRTLAVRIDEVPLTLDSLQLVPLGLPDDADSLVPMALAARPELRAQEQRRVSLERARAAIQAEGAPALKLAADYGMNGGIADGRVEQTGAVAVQLTWSPWDGGRRSARAGEQTARLREADARLHDLEAGIQVETRSAAATWRATRVAVETARERTTLAQRELAQAEQRYESGLSGSLDVISAQEGLIEAEDALIDALADYNTAVVAVRHATGTLDAL